MQFDFSGLSVEIDRRVVNGIAASNYIPYQASVRVSVRDHARFGRGMSLEAFPVFNKPNKILFSKATLVEEF